MGAKPDYVRKKFAPLLDKTLRNALAHRIGCEFPRIGGQRVLALCADMILEVVGEHLRAREHVAHGNQEKHRQHPRHGLRKRLCRGRAARRRA